MDVFDEQMSSSSSSSSSSIGENDNDSASDALAALTEGMNMKYGNDGEDDTMSFKGSIDVDRSATRQSKKIGLVNAYFNSDDEIKILVVEIDDVMHNLTWKGLA